MKLTWLTDIHLNFLHHAARLNFYQEIRNASGDAVVITGDIDEAPSVSAILTEMANNIQQPIYFVVGNHDYYRGQVDAVRQELADLTQKEALLHWLPASGAQDLGNNTVILGQDGWADGRYGDYANSPVILNDSRYIQDLYLQKILGKYPLLDEMQRLADEDAAQLKNSLIEALKKDGLKKIIILTHVPPFKDACMHEGNPTDDDYLPFFSSKVTGDVILEVAAHHKGIEFLVLCGHTHSEAFCQPLENLTVKTGKAVYMKPAIQEVITI